MGNKGIGRQIQFGIAKESVRGTEEASASYWLDTLDLEFDEKVNTVVEEQTEGVIEDSTGLKVVQKWAEGSTRVYIDDISIPLILESLLGTLASSLHSGESAVYDHDISVAQSAQHQSLTLFENDPLAGADYKHALGMVTNLELAFEHAKILDYTMNLMSKKGESAVLTPANTAVKRFLPKHCTVKIATNLAGLAGASALDVNVLNLTINQNVEPDYVLGSEDPNDFYNKQMTVEGDLQINWDAETYRDLVLDNTDQALQIDLVHSDTIGSASNPQVRIQLAKCNFSELARDLAQNEIVKQTLTFKAHYSADDSEMINVLCVNTVASY